MFARGVPVLTETPGTEATKACPDRSGLQLDSVLRAGSSGCPTIIGRLCLSLLDPPMVSERLITKEVVLSFVFLPSFSLEPLFMAAATSGREPGRREVRVGDPLALAETPGTEATKA